MGVARRTAIPLALTVGLVACGLVGEHGPSGEEPVGPTVVVAEDSDGEVTWRYEVYRTAEGYCDVIVSGDRGGPVGCAEGNVDIEPGTVSVSAGSGTDQPTFVHGRAGDDVAAVRITTSAGEVHTVETIAAPAQLGLSGRFFFEVLPDEVATQSVATLDGEGSVLETIEFTVP